FAGLEALVTAFCDEFPHIVGRYREFFVLGLVTYCYFGTLPSTTYDIVDNGSSASGISSSWSTDL
uniref:Uncharacterized protein n=1 Tax=Romanomermis culicivorax TaxID=13658 RepID=A0A915KKP1_ROMCU